MEVTSMTTQMPSPTQHSETISSTTFIISTGPEKQEAIKMDTQNAVTIPAIVVPIALLLIVSGVVGFLFWRRW